MNKSGCFLVLVSSFAILGCGESGNPVIGDVYEGGRGTLSGTVTMGGKPVGDAVVSFQSSDGKFSLIGTTDDEGKYSALDQTQDEGEQQAVPALEYSATVEAGMPEVNVDSEETGYDPDAANSGGPDGPDIPAQFASAESSGLSVTVKAEGETVFDISLD